MAFWSFGSKAGALYNDETTRIRQSVEEGKGWYVNVPTRRPHFCFPPRAYPQQIGPPSQWKCEVCEAVWEAHGIQLLDHASDYPVGGEGRARRAIMGPESWEFKIQGRFDYAKSPEQINAEEDLYDFRPLGPHFAGLLEDIASGVLRIRL